MELVNKQSFKQYYEQNIEKFLRKNAQFTVYFTLLLNVEVSSSRHVISICKWKTWHEWYSKTPGRRNHCHTVKRSHHLTRTICGNDMEW